VATLKKTFVVTHPFHPLYLQKFQLVSYLKSYGQERVEYLNRNGHVCSIPLEWTDVLPIDPFLYISNGRSIFRTEELLRLVELVADLSKSTFRNQEKEGEQCKDNRAAYVK